MKEKLKEYALIAEILGGIAIVLSLIFVGLQIKQSNEVNLANGYRELLREINQVQSVLMTDENVHRVWLAFINGEVNTLSQSDYVRLRQAIGQLLRAYESAFYAFNYSQLGISEWERIGAGVCRVTTQLTDQLWRDLSQLVTEEFREFIETECQ